ncbi:hypothetical protein [Modestobacter italicus]|uniref:hypothetical protein n=1 Tax=Modestobacter italicus (strain DSM 44449 / CECT 9708 / BC 501) TaxID=2732864 RepID=UPI001C95D341|nr:hypothetical protein [Modestobacter italicus]
MSKPALSQRTLVAGLAWVALTVLAFLTDPVLGAVVLIFGGIGVVVVQLSSTWSEHPDFEAREQARAARRKVKWEKNTPKREKDAARYAAHQARQAAKARESEARQSRDRAGS